MNAETSAYFSVVGSSLTRNIRIFELNMMEGNWLSPLDNIPGYDRERKFFLPDADSSELSEYIESVRRVLKRIQYLCAGDPYLGTLIGLQCSSEKIELIKGLSGSKQFLLFKNLLKNLK